MCRQCLTAHYSIRCTVHANQHVHRDMLQHAQTSGDQQSTVVPTLGSVSKTALPVLLYRVLQFRPGIVSGNSQR